MSEFSINLPPRLPTAGPAPNILTAIIPDPPRQLAQLDNGTIIKGQVQGRDPDGLLVVATDKGALKLSTPANIPTGSTVTLEVRTGGDRLHVLVLSIDGQPAAGAGGQGTRGAAATPAAAGLQSHAPPPSAAVPAPVAIAGSLLAGTIVQASPDTLAQLIRSLLPGPPLAQPGAAARAPAAPAAPAASTAPGAAAEPLPGQGASGQGAAAREPGLPKALASTLQPDVRAKIEALFFSAPPAKFIAAPGAQTSALPAGESAARGLSYEVPSALKRPFALATGSDVRLRLNAVASQPGQPPVASAAASGAQHVVAGRIIGYTPSGNAVLHSPLGAIILQGQLSLPVGTELSVAIESAPPVPGTAAPPGAARSLPQLLLSVARSWPALAEAVATLRQTMGEADALAALARLPQPGPRLAAGIVAAMQAIHANDAGALLGALVAARTGNPAREETVRKVRQELAQVSTLAQERPGTDWRCCFIPVLDDGTIRQINLFYRRDRRGDRRQGKEEKAGTRFVVEVDMSRMGPFQFDGLVREKQFDLMVRSHIALPQPFKHDIIALFQEALSLGEYRGGLVFQTVREFPVSPLEEIERSATRVSA